MFKLRFLCFFQRIRFLLPEQRFFCIMAVMEGRCLLQVFDHDVSKARCTDYGMGKIAVN